MLLSKYLISISEEKPFSVKYEIVIYKPGERAFSFHFIETTQIVKILRRNQLPGAKCTCCYVYKTLF